MPTGFSYDEGSGYRNATNHRVEKLLKRYPKMKRDEAKRIAFRMGRRR